MHLLRVLWSELLEAAVLVKKLEFLSQKHMKTELQISTGKQNNSWWPKFAPLSLPVPASPHCWHSSPEVKGHSGTWSWLLSSPKDKVTIQETKTCVMYLKISNVYQKKKKFTFKWLINVVAETAFPQLVWSRSKSFSPPSSPSRATAQLTGSCAQQALAYTHLSGYNTLLSPHL